MTLVPALPAQVTIRDVGPRDGLQPEAPVPVAERVRLVEALIAAGVAHIEIAAFVSPKAVPAMAGATEVFAGVPPAPGVVRAALVPNARGAEMALAAGADELTVTISASETYNQRNVKMSTEMSVTAIDEIVRLARAGSPEDPWPVPVDAVISCAFGSPYEGEIAPAEVAELAARLSASGVTSLTYADTTGMATPRRVTELLHALVASDLPVAGGATGLHLHDTRGTALVNAYAALEAGVSRFDTSVGGLGGSPFAAGAAGNLATEDLVHLLDDMGVTTGIDLERLLTTSAPVAPLVGHAVPSRVAAAGPRTHLARR